MDLFKVRTFEAGFVDLSEAEGGDGFVERPIMEPVDIRLCLEVFCSFVSPI